MKNVCLVGNPNTGKTTLFNTLTSSNEHVGNWHGVTVEEKGRVYKFEGQEINLVDLPGIYSLSPLSFEEQVARDYIIKHQDHLIVNICDASNLRRNLYLTLCLMELGVEVILVVNQIDKRPICKVDYVKLEKLLGVKILHINAGCKSDADRVNRAILTGGIQAKYNLPHLNNLDFSSVQGCVAGMPNENYYKTKLLEDDGQTKQEFGISKMFGGCDEVAAARYAYIDSVLSVVSSQNQRVYGKSKLDKLLLNRFLALPTFLILLAGVFYLTFFSLGSWLSGRLEFAIEGLIFSPISKWLTSLFGKTSWIVGLFDAAIAGGVGSVVSFLPQVALLFLFLSILEDSGYLSRIAFLFDDVLSKVGLSGKAVYTLLMGFGCSTTAVLTARNMEDKNSKIKTALLTPYMSCSAKFPIYSVLGGAFFGAGNIWVVLGLYLLGVVIAVLISFVLEKTALKSKSQSFILEFPPYRMTSFKRTARLLWQNVKLFLSRVGGLIVAMNIIVWLLSNFTVTLSYIGGGRGVSILETVGRVLAPIFIPLGFGNWALVASLIAGLVAKEVIVSTIGMFNGVEGSGATAGSILSLSAVAGFASASSVLSYLVFCLLYVPCFATISVLSKEIGRKWTFISIIIEFMVAYAASFMVYNVASACEIFGSARVLILLGVLTLIIVAVAAIFKRFINKKGCPYGKRCNKACKKK
ncbi:MAG: ferrous iron transport protein B [Clostridia bacterium]|nr:ferrous iron transport protein B [Clostridia bacterium]